MSANNPTPSTKLSALDEMLAHIAIAVEQWKQRNDAETLTRKVHADLDEASKDIVLKLLGFDHTYRGYQLDHCNNRSGNSTAGDYLAQVQSEAIKAWLSKVPIPALTEAEEKALVHEMRGKYLSKLRYAIDQQIGHLVEAHAKTFLEEAIRCDSFDKYLEMLSTIDPFGGSRV